MGVIQTRAELLLEGTATPEKGREGLEIILKQIERISRIVRMLLDYARVRESRRATCDIQTIIKQVVKLVETEAKRKDVRIVTHLEDYPIMIHCDPDQLQQVFVNLAVNAFDAMTPDGGRLVVTSSIAQ